MGGPTEFPWQALLEISRGSLWDPTSYNRSRGLRMGSRGNDHYTGITRGMPRDTVGTRAMPRGITKGSRRFPPNLVIHLVGVSHEIPRSNPSSSKN